MKTERLFVAAEIPEAIVEEIISLRNEVFDATNRVKWEPKEKYHITLKFLGDTSDVLIPQIKESLSRTFETWHKVPTAFTRFGVFFRNGAPKILWAGFEPTEDLIGIHAEVEEALTEFGFDKEKRRFHPHLTIARLKGFEPIEKINELRRLEFSKKPFEIGNIILFKSELKPSGSVYSEIENFELKN